VGHIQSTDMVQSPNVEACKTALLTIPLGKCVFLQVATMFLDFRHQTLSPHFPAYCLEEAVAQAIAHLGATTLTPTRWPPVQEQLSV
jgi:hypothetical protein